MNVNLTFVNLIFLILGIIYYLSIGLLINTGFVAPKISEYNKTKNKKIPSYLIIIILIITPFTYPILYIIFYSVMFCHKFNIKKRFHDYFNLD